MELKEYETMTDAEMHTLVRTVYLDVCLENAWETHPAPSALPAAIRSAEDAFVRYLEDFFAAPENRYYVLEEAGVPVSAVRLTELDGFYYMEALETAPIRRGSGCATQLLTQMIALLRSRGCADIRCCVKTTNAASLAVHRKCGFRAVGEPGVNYLSGGVCDGTCGMCCREE